MTPQQSNPRIQWILLVLVTGFALLSPSVLAAPTKIEPGDIGYLVWDPLYLLARPQTQNALRFVDTGVDDFDYESASPDPWLNDSLVAIVSDPSATSNFDFGVWNQSHLKTFDGLILLIAYRGSGADFSFTLDIGSGASSPFAESDFQSLADYSVFGGGGNRPGDGEGALYKSAEGVIFIDLGAGSGLGQDTDNKWGVPPDNDTLDIDLAITPSIPLPGDFALHFDAYGYHATGLQTPYAIITDTNPNSSDLTVVVPEASTMILFGGGLIGLLGVARRRIRSLIGH